MQQSESKRSPESADVRHLMPTAEHGWKNKIPSSLRGTRKMFLCLWGLIIKGQSRKRTYKSLFFLLASQGFRTRADYTLKK